MRYGRKFQFDSHAFTVALDLFLREVCPIICDDAVWCSTVKNNRLDEVDCGCGILGCYGGCLYPLGKFVDCH
jgi:hypothetical protein